MFFGFTKQTKKQPKHIEFRFEPKKKFDCFEDTLILWSEEIEPAPQSWEIS
jgi:hypothetical protein